MTCRALVLENSHLFPDVYRGVGAGRPWPRPLSQLDSRTLGITRGQKYATDFDALSVYVQLASAEGLCVRVLAAAVSPSDIDLLPHIRTRFIGHDVCLRTLYSLVEQSVLLGVPEGTRAVSLRSELNEFGLFDRLETAERVRAMWREEPSGFDVFGADDVDVLPLYWVLSMPGCEGCLSQPASSGSVAGA